MFQWIYTWAGSDDSFYRLQFGGANRPSDFKHELFPLHSPLLGESLLVSFPPLSYMLKSSGSSYQFEARLGGRHVLTYRPSVHPCGRLQPATVAIPTTNATCPVNDRCCLATTYHAGKQTVRCTGICAVRLFTSGDTARLDPEGPAGTAQASARASRETQLNGRRQPRHGE